MFYNKSNNFYEKSIKLKKINKHVNNSIIEQFLLQEEANKKKVTMTINKIKKFIKTKHVIIHYFYILSYYFFR